MLLESQKETMQGNGKKKKSAQTQLTPISFASGVKRRMAGGAGGNVAASRGVQRLFSVILFSKAIGNVYGFINLQEGVWRLPRGGVGGEKVSGQGFRQGRNVTVEIEEWVEGFLQKYSEGSPTAKGDTEEPCVPQTQPSKGEPDCLSSGRKSGRGAQKGGGGVSGQKNTSNEGERYGLRLD